MAGPSTLYRWHWPSLLVIAMFWLLPMAVQPRADQKQNLAWVESAIEFGQHDKRAEPVRIGKRNTGIGVLRSFGRDPGLGFFTTPFVRVALASAQARERSRPFTRKDVLPWMLDPIVTVYLPAYENATPEHVVIRPVGDDRPTAAIQPTRTRSMNSERDSIVQVGQTRAFEALVADFPLKALRPGYEFYFVLRWQQDEDRKVRSYTAKITDDIITLAGCPVACR